MSKNRNKSYTLVLFSNGTEQPRSLVVSSRTLIAIGCVAIGIFLIASSAAVDYVQLLLEKNHSRWLRVENEYLKAQFKEIEGKLSTLESGLERVDNFSKKLRLITNVGASTTSMLELQVPSQQSLPNTTKPMPAEGGVRWPANIGPMEADFDNYRYAGAGADVLGEAIKSNYSTIAVRIERVSDGTEALEKDVMQLWKDLSDKNEILQTTPSIRPTQGWVSSNFGMRNSPFSGDPAQHKGLDIAADPGAPIHAPASGIVTAATLDSGYGKVITVDHGHGIVTRYGHCSQMYVKAGQKVKRGDVIGAVGNTGRSTGPHLHYEVRLQGVPVNPERYILE